MSNSLGTPGLHHVTAIASDPSANHAFYTETLGLRMVKRSVNQDDVGVYHLFYADDQGTPGTSVTFFPYVGARPGRVGDGQASTVSFTVPAGSLDYWTDRLTDRGLDVETFERFGDAVVAFADPDGLPLELVAREDAPAGDPPAGPVPEAHAIRGFFAVELSLSEPGSTVDLLREMGYEQTASDEANHRSRFETDGDVGFVVDVVSDPATPQGTPGAGTVHHVAYRVTDAEQESWRELLQSRGLRPSQVIDRKWFRSVYARTPGGVLFEFATAEPGYDVDEPQSSLGESLVLPEWLEGRREEIEAGLPELETATPAAE
ncbi:VOC family protein [Halorubrum sp. DTA46]|uniref:VOC family protein n=1 Tax=Halorubrum sp. DTA46 TaxID=3402162 RepID=UPI003AAD6575